LPVPGKLAKFTKVPEWPTGPGPGWVLFFVAKYICFDPGKLEDEIGTK